MGRFLAAPIDFDSGRLGRRRAVVTIKGMVLTIKGDISIS